MKNAHYDTNLTDAQWAIISKLLPKRARRGRKPRDRRTIINAILYITKSGCQWRLLPLEFGPWKTVYHVFN